MTTETAFHSVVVPVFDEADGIAKFHERCVAALETMGDPFELVYVDDGCRDASWNILTGFAAADPRVKLVRLSRNFGHQIAITAGIDHASGDTVTVIDADLQDPPEVICQLVEKWRAGADIVYAVRSERTGDSWFKRSTASAYYRVLAGMSDVELPLDAGDFRLMSRRAADAFLAMPEHHRYVRGMVAWLGFPSARVEYVREARFAGETKYPLRKMLKFATDGILAFSTRPLRIATWLGLLVSAAAFVYAAVLVVMRLVGNIVVQGWTSIAVLVLLLSGVQLVTIGALGEYVGRIYTEVRQRPLYLVADARGFDEFGDAEE